jgi:putative two-component system response regulator
MTDEPNILVVDDDEDVRGLIVRTLERGGFACRSAASTVEARACLDQIESELVLSDIQMPGESGFALIRHVMREHRDTAIVMVSGFDDREVWNQAVELGVFGYIIKPFRPSELLVTVQNALHRRRLELESRSRRDLLEQAVRERTADLRASRAETIDRLGRLAEFRDDATGQHVQRVSRYCTLIGEAMGLSPHRIELLRIASPLHDVGKVAIPDSVLLKPGPLTPEERLTIERHAEIGHEILSGSRQELLDLAALIAWTHHEWFDGSGYPRRLAGPDIPLEGRIVAVADVFDALTIDRVYRPCLELPDALELIEAGRGGHFDPAVVEAFLANRDEARRVHESYRDQALDGGSFRSQRARGA